MTSSCSVISLKSTLFCGREIEGVGLNAARNITGIPEEIPPSMPPWLLVSVTTFPSLSANSSLFSLPNMSAQPNPLPNSIPFTAGIANTSRDITFSRPSIIGEPTPAGIPTAAHSITPPTLLSCSLAESISARIFSSASSDNTGKLLDFTASSCSAVASTPSAGLKVASTPPRISIPHLISSMPAMIVVSLSP